MWTTYYWIVEDEESEIDGEEFFTELEGASKAQHREYVSELFPNVNIRCGGRVTEEEAEYWGLDTY